MHPLYRRRVSKVATPIRTIPDLDVAVARNP
jgi:hypothetical protein